MTQIAQAGPTDIDAVILWVDGNDPVHRAKRLAWQANLPPPPPPMQRPRPDTATAVKSICVSLRFCVSRLGWAGSGLSRMTKNRIFWTTSDLMGRNPNPILDLLITGTFSAIISNICQRSTPCQSKQ
ncbi:hypothetical protein FTO60_13135 [Octadecabacter sp. SW4]|nr:hypothetical protein FTO60_13135 [Octadecabacter sp. SW4]